MNTRDDLIYAESVSSKRTEALFVALTTLFFLLLIWRFNAAGLDFLSVAFFCLFGLFFFYSVNYRTLHIRLTADSLKLKFGVFTWTIAMDNIAACQLDVLPVLPRLGGAGIHFMFVDKRYRASFNFLEYARIVIALKKSVGPVRDVSFTTRRPENILRLIRKAI